MSEATEILTNSQFELFSSPKYMGENPDYLSEQLITYIGNKRKLLPFIARAMESSIGELKKESVSFADVFAGSGVVSRMARKWAHTLYINDIEEYSAYINNVYHSTNLNLICRPWIRKEIKLTKSLLNIQ